VFKLSRAGGLLPIPNHDKNGLIQLEIGMDHHYTCSPCIPAHQLQAGYRVILLAMNVAIYKKWPTIGSSRALVRERLCLLFSIAIAAAAIVRDWEVSGRRWISKNG
jgi:hypothetical protein